MSQSIPKCAENPRQSTATSGFQSPAWANLRRVDIDELLKQIPARKNSGYQNKRAAIRSQYVDIWTEYSNFFSLTGSQLFALVQAQIQIDEFNGIAPQMDKAQLAECRAMLLQFIDKQPEPYKLATGTIAGLNSEQREQARALVYELFAVFGLDDDDTSPTDTTAPAETVSGCLKIHRRQYKKTTPPPSHRIAAKWRIKSPRNTLAYPNRYPA